MRQAARVLLLIYVFTIPWEYSLDLGAPFGNIARMVGLLAADSDGLCGVAGGQKYTRQILCNGSFSQCTCG